MRRKIVMGFLALALPVGVLGVTQTAAVAKKSAPNPITCSGVNGTVVFPATETNEGTVTTAKKSGATSVTGTTTFSCTEGVTAGVGSLSIAGGKNAKDKSAGKGKYLEGEWSQFLAAGLNLKKSLKTVGFTLNGLGTTFKTSSSSVDNGCPNTDIGFSIVGTVKSGTWATAKNGAVINACLGSDTRADNSHGSFGSDINTDNGGGVVSAQIDPSASNATL